MKLCSVEGCNNKVHAKGYCSKHYMQVRRYGYVLERTKYDSNKIILHDKYAEIVMYNKDCEEIARATVDIEDVDKVKNYKWCLSHGYAMHSGKFFLHRLIMNCPDDMVIDHINHDPLDNRKENLRICTQQQNMMNRRTQSNNTSGITGVNWDKSKNKWRVQIALNKIHYTVGYYENIDEAIQERKQAEADLFGEYRNNDEDVS